MPCGVKEKQNKFLKLHNNTMQIRRGRIKSRVLKSLYEAGGRQECWFFLDFGNIVISRSTIKTIDTEYKTLNLLERENEMRKKSKG